LKNLAWERIDNQIRVAFDVRDQFVIDDPDGTVARLFDLLGVGEHTLVELAAALGLPEADIAEAIESFDEVGLLEDASKLSGLPPPAQERYFSNLAFFESFASLRRSKEDFQRQVCDSHVLVLGTGGLNSSVVQSLCGLGVGRLTLLDRDIVEARNFARQYLYRWEDIGARKVDRAASWIRNFDPGIEIVDAIDGDIGGPKVVADLLDRYCPDVVAVGVDRPKDIAVWVNQACVSRGVPYVRGGMWVTQGMVRSVEPGVHACLACTDDAATNADPEIAEMQAGVDLYGSRPSMNRGIGPVAGLLGSLAAFEILRFLTRFEEPVYTQGYTIIDFANGCQMRQTSAARNPNCLVCGRRADRSSDP
jgi:molybdopterin/thiamine biosynthesis adenylyltransferase